jgi:hypothetical protein
VAAASLIPVRAYAAGDGKDRGVATVRARARALDDCRANKIPETRRTHLMITTLEPMLVADLAGQVSRSVLGPQDAGDDAARAVHNGLIDRKTVLIVRCRTTNDVIAALALERRAGLEVSIRGGGHNVAGRAATDGGVMIDLAEMKGIVIDPDRATATWRAAWSEGN